MKWEDIIGQAMEKWRINKYSASLISAFKWIIFITLIQCLIWFIWIYPYLRNLIEEKKDNEVSFETHSFFISLLFALIGIVFSVRALVDSDKQEREIKDQRRKLLETARHLKKIRQNLESTTRHLDKISDSLSTRYVNIFPNSIKDITKLIGNAGRDFQILADCADYGSFSDPVCHAEMIQALEELHAKNLKRSKPVKIQLRICGPHQLISRSSEFWELWQRSKDNDDAWIELRDKPAFKDRLVDFCNANKIVGFNINGCSREQFVKIMEDKHNQVENHLRVDLRVDIEKFPNLEHMPGVFFWMKDGKEAVFVLSHTGPGTQGIAFYTHDGDITDILKIAWNAVKDSNLNGEINSKAFDREHSTTNFLKLFPSVERDQINAVVEFEIEARSSRVSSP